MYIFISGKICQRGDESEENFTRKKNCPPLQISGYVLEQES